MSRLPYRPGSHLYLCTDLADVATEQVVNGWQVFEQRRVADGSSTGRKTFVNHHDVLCCISIAEDQRLAARRAAVPELVAALTALVNLPRPGVVEGAELAALRAARAALASAEGVS